MAQIAPLTPLRYDLARLASGLASVVAPPYDVISAEERAALAALHPRNVVNLILPQASGELATPDAKYVRAGALFEEWSRDGTLLRDGEPSFYRYDQTFSPPGGGARLTRRGFLALVRLSPFAERQVLPHERTLSGPKEDRLKLFRATRANLSPGFMLYRDPRGELEGPLGHAELLADFTTPDGVHHTLSKVRELDAVRAIVEGVSRSSLLIADGHHRYETALRYRDEVAGDGLADDAEPHYFMTFLANGDSPDLVVFPTHRHVHSLPSFSFDELLQRARDWFHVEDLAAGATADTILATLASARDRHASGIESTALAAAAADGRVSILTLRHDQGLDGHPTLGDKPPALRRTDVAVLHSGILEHILGVTPQAQAAKTNLWYPQNARAALAELRSGKGQVLFLMNATPVAHVRAVAEAGEVMPQKSTYFFPKVLTGLAIHTLEPARRVARVSIPYPTS